MERFSVFSGTFGLRRPSSDSCRESMKVVSCLSVTFPPFSFPDRAKPKSFHASVLKVIHTSTNLLDPLRLSRHPPLPLSSPGTMGTQGLMGNVVPVLHYLSLIAVVMNPSRPRWRRDTFDSVMFTAPLHQSRETNVGNYRRKAEGKISNSV